MANASNYTYSELGRHVSHYFQIDGYGIMGSLDLYASPSTQEWPLGTRAVCTDGRVFRSCHITAATNRATLVGPDISVCGMDWTDSCIPAYAAGVTQITISTTNAASVTENLWADCFVYINDADGEGYMYKIKRNSAVSASVVTVDLYDTLQVATVAATSDGGILPSQYRELILSSAADDTRVTGVLLPTAAADDYCWVQTWGLAICLADLNAGTQTAGTIVTLSDGVDGAIQPMAGGAATNAMDEAIKEPIVGYWTNTITSPDGEHTPFMCTIAP